MESSKAVKILCLQALMSLLNELSNLPFLVCIGIPPPAPPFPQINATSLEPCFPLCPHVFSCLCKLLEAN